MTKNKALKLALIWLLLVLAVFLYTDGEEYTWRYAQGELSLILETREQASAAQQASDEAYAQEAAEAAQRQARGEWGGNVQYGGAPETLPARDDTPGLNLMWGAYEVTLSYASPELLRSAWSVRAVRRSFRMGKPCLRLRRMGRRLPLRLR